jgi:hypothetical protein
MNNPKMVALKLVLSNGYKVSGECCGVSWKSDKGANEMTAPRLSQLKEVTQ